MFYLLFSQAIKHNIYLIKKDKTKPNYIFLTFCPANSSSRFPEDKYKNQSVRFACFNTLRIFRNA